MYCAINENDEIIAYHEDKEVVETYIYNVMRSNESKDINLDLVKIKNKLIINNYKYDDLYLVRYGSTYIQTGYLMYLQIVSDDIAGDNIYAKDLLLRMLEIYKLSNKEAKAITKAVKVIDKIIEDEDYYTPTITELKKYKSMYSRYEKEAFIE